MQAGNSQQMREPGIPHLLTDILGNIPPQPGCQGRRDAATPPAGPSIREVMRLDIRARKDATYCRASARKPLSPAEPSRSTGPNANPTAPSRANHAFREKS
jgi:hypothetical protein